MGNTKTTGTPSVCNGQFLVEAVALSKWFYRKHDVVNAKPAVVTAVDRVSCGIRRGTVLGVVGESGCGKTTLGRMMVNLLEPSEGTVFFDGQDITHIGRREMHTIRRRMQIVFQDPFSSLDPRMTVYEIVGESLKNYRMVKNRKELRERVEYLAERCGLFADQCSRYPHEFSGGQRQRICIARALAAGPDFVVCDEAVSALDVSIQAQVINLLKDLQEEMGLTYLFVSHDLTVVEFISDEVAVMYLGQIVEQGRTEEVFRRPLHPYTEALLSAAPAFLPEEKAAKKRLLLEGDIPSPANPPQGCRFSSRCPQAEPHCREAPPPYREAAPGHFAACHRLNG
ncbi:ABC transporter ATP-binding protein [Spirochaetia bacterium]|nr:ABC transporter ATP-binding protein [Spirochaetia bacterium]